MPPSPSRCRPWSKAKATSRPCRRGDLGPGEGKGQEPIAETLEASGLRYPVSSLSDVLVQGPWRNVPRKLYDGARSAATSDLVEPAKRRNATIARNMIILINCREIT